MKGEESQMEIRHLGGGRGVMIVLKTTTPSLQDFLEISEVLHYKRVVLNLRYLRGKLGSSFLDFVKAFKGEVFFLNASPNHKAVLSEHILDALFLSF